MLFLVLVLFNTFNLEAFFDPPPKKINVQLFKRTPPLDFSRTLLIINYNHPFYQSIPFLREIYSEVFPHIVFYGEQPHPEVNVYATHMGYFCQDVIADAMEKWPDFEGYICVQDDCFMNFWNFARLDKNKIWITSPRTSIKGQNRYSSFFDVADPKRHPWPWVNLPIGKQAVLKALGNIPSRNLQILESNCGENNILGSLVDFVYIPGRLKDQYIFLCKLISNPPIFVEIAIPFIFTCIEDIHNWEFLHTLWGPEDIYKSYGAHYDWVHPFKFSNPNSQNFIRNIMNTWKAKNNW